MSNQIEIDFVSTKIYTDVKDLLNLRDGQIAFSGKTDGKDFSSEKELESFLCNHIKPI